MCLIADVIIVEDNTNCHRDHDMMHAIVKGKCDNVGTHMHTAYQKRQRLAQEWLCLFTHPAKF